MSDTVTTKSEGLGFVGVLQLIFITLKLCKVIKWHWWAVLLPMEVSITIALVVLALIIFLPD